MWIIASLSAWQRFALLGEIRTDSRVGERQKIGSSLPRLTPSRHPTRMFGTSCQTPSNGQRKRPFANSHVLPQQGQYAFAASMRGLSLKPS